MLCKMDRWDEETETKAKKKQGVSKRQKIQDRVSIFTFATEENQC